jgi:cytidine deaminase
MSSADPRRLIERARSLLDRAYAPYSKFPVSAVVVDDRGREFTGVNIENVSYGLTICAERVAIFTAVAAGASRIAAIAITSEKCKPIAPCGACRQVMVEFCNPEAKVFSDAGDNQIVTWTVGELLPDTLTSLEPYGSKAD